MAVTLTHDTVRLRGGAWRCVNCGKEGASIGDVNAFTCPNQPTDSARVIEAIKGEGPFKGDKQ